MMAMHRLLAALALLAARVQSTEAPTRMPTTTVPIQALTAIPTTSPATQEPTGNPTTASISPTTSTPTASASPTIGPSRGPSVLGVTEMIKFQLPNVTTQQYHIRPASFSYHVSTHLQESIRASVRDYFEDRHPSSRERSVQVEVLNDDTNAGEVRITFEPEPVGYSMFEIDTLARHLRANPLTLRITEPREEVLDLTNNTASSFAIELVGLDAVPAPVVPDPCEDIPCSWDCYGACGWNTISETCRRERTPIGSLDLTNFSNFYGQCSSRPTAMLTRSPTDWASTYCAQFLCVLDCTRGSCGWNGNVDRCVYGGVTSDFEVVQQRGNCSEACRAPDGESRAEYAARAILCGFATGPPSTPAPRGSAAPVAGSITLAQGVIIAVIVAIVIVLLVIATRALRTGTKQAPAPPWLDMVIAPSMRDNSYFVGVKDEPAVPLDIGPVDKESPFGDVKTIERFPGESWGFVWKPSDMHGALITQVSPGGASSRHPDVIQPGVTFLSVNGIDVRAKGKDAIATVIARVNRLTLVVGTKNLDGQCVCVSRHQQEAWGIDVAHSELHGLTIVKVGGGAAARYPDLKRGCTIVELNGMNTRTMDPSAIGAVMKDSLNINLEFGPHRHDSEAVLIARHLDEPWGFTLVSTAHGLIVSSVTDGGAAGRYPAIQTGLGFRSINGVDTRNVRADDVVEAMRRTTALTVVYEKPAGVVIMQRTIGEPWGLGVKASPAGVLITQINQGGCADRYPQIRPGTVMKVINGISTADLPLASLAPFLNESTVLTVELGESLGNTGQLGEFGITLTRDSSKQAWGFSLRPSPKGLLVSGVAKGSPSSTNLGVGCTIVSVNGIDVRHCDVATLDRALKVSMSIVLSVLPGDADNVWLPFKAPRLRPGTFLDLEKEDGEAWGFAMRPCQEGLLITGLMQGCAAARYTSIVPGTTIRKIQGEDVVDMDPSELSERLHELNRMNVVFGRQMIEETVVLRRKAGQSWGLGLKPTSGGMGVKSVEEGGPANVADVVTGDQIRSFNGTLAVAENLTKLGDVMNKAGNRLTLVLIRYDPPVVDPLQIVPGDNDGGADEAPIRQEKLSGFVMDAPGSKSAEAALFETPTMAAMSSNTSRWLLGGGIVAGTEADAGNRWNAQSAMVGDQSTLFDLNEEPNTAPLQTFLFGNDATAQEDCEGFNA